MSYIDRQIDAHKQGAEIGKKLIYESLGQRIFAYFIIFYIPVVIAWIIISNTSGVLRSLEIFQSLPRGFEFVIYAIPPPYYSFI